MIFVKSQIDPYENLANAIIIQAINDYSAAKRKLKKYPNNNGAKSTIINCELFFKSNYIKYLTKMDIKYLLNQLQKKDIKSKYSF